MSNPEVDATLSKLRSECELCGARSSFTGRTKVSDGLTYVVVLCPNGDGEFTVWKHDNEPLVGAYERARASARDPEAYASAFAVLTGSDRAALATLIAAPPQELPLFSIDDVDVPRESAERWCELLLDWPGWRPTPTRRVRIEEALATAAKYDVQRCVDRVLAHASAGEVAAVRGDVARRFPARPSPIAATLRRWAENVCRIRTTARAELVAAVDGHDDTKLPDGVTWLTLDDRDVGLGGVWLRFAQGAITRTQFEAVFGRGEGLVRVPATAPAKYMTTVQVSGAPHRCTVIAEYRSDVDDVDLQGLYLRSDRARR